MFLCPNCKAETKWVENSYKESKSLFYERGHYECAECGWSSEVHVVKIRMQS
jgi:transposase-like protein